MKNTYKIIWTNHAKKELENTYSYLEYDFTIKEISRLTQAIEKKISLISENPKFFKQQIKKM